MDWRRRVVIGLAVLHVLLSTYVLLWLEVWNGPPWLAALFLALAPSQSCLLALWAVFGGSLSPWRMVAVATAVISYAWVIQCAGGPSEMWFWLTLLIPQTLALLPLILFTRFAGVWLTYPRSPRDDLRTHRMQFSLRQALLWMTIIAVLLGVYSYLPEGLIDRARSEWSGTGHCLIAGTSIVSAWLVLGPGRLAVRVPFGAACMGVLTGLWQSVGQPSVFAVLLPIQAAWIIATLVVVRFVGYGLHWDWPLGQPERASDVPSDELPDSEDVSGEDSTAMQ